MGMTDKEILAALYSWLGARAILLPFPLGAKSAEGTGWLDWQETTFEMTQEPGYQARLFAAIRRGGNVGVLLVNGLASIDIDASDRVEQMLELNPEFSDTLQSKGYRGRNIWLQILGEYPQRVHKLKTTDGKKWGEWRAVTGQTIIFGQHPDSTAEQIIRYSCVVRKQTIQKSFSDILWPDDLPLPWLHKQAPVQSPSTQVAPVNPDLHERILAYLTATPPAIEHNGGDEQTFKAATALVNGWALTAEQALPYLQIYSDKCQPSWSEKELRHKLEEAEKYQHPKPKGHLIGCTLNIKKKGDRPRDEGDDWQELERKAEAATVYKPYDFSDPISVEFDEDTDPFPLDVFPSALKAPIEEMVRHYKVKVALPAMVTLSVNSAAIGRGIIVMSNVRRTYANIYALLGAESGTGKSVVHEDLAQVMLDVQNEILEKFLKEEKPSLEAELKLLEREIQQIIKEAVPDHAGDTRQLRLTDLFKRQAELNDQLESAYRLVSSDFTSEALGKLLAASGEQMAVLSDEGGIALYNMMGRYTKGDTTDDIFLSMCKTVTSHIVDRATRAPILLKAPCVTLLLMVQPDLLNKAFADERLRVGGFLPDASSLIQGCESSTRTNRVYRHRLPPSWERGINTFEISFRRSG
jgi:hypothetical protein